MTEYAALSRGQRQDIRASQRTFEGAYMRTALSKVSFGLLILRVFSKEFLSIGVLFVVSSMLTLALTIYQRKRNERRLIDEPSTTFTTNGDFVALTAAVDVSSVVALLVLLNTMDP